MTPEQQPFEFAPGLDADLTRLARELEIEAGGMVKPEGVAVAEMSSRLTATRREALDRLPERLKP